MLFKKSAELPTPETALPGRAEPLATDANHVVTGHPLKGPYPDGFQTAIFGMGLFLGRGAHFLAAAGRVGDLGRLFRWPHAQSDL